MFFWGWSVCSNQHHNNNKSDLPSRSTINSHIESKTSPTPSLASNSANRNSTADALMASPLVNAANRKPLITISSPLSDLSHVQDNHFHSLQQHQNVNKNLIYNSSRYHNNNHDGSHNNVSFQNHHSSSTNLGGSSTSLGALRKTNSTSTIPNLRPRPMSAANTPAKSKFGATGSGCGSGAQSIKGFEKQRIRNKFLFFLKRTQTANAIVRGSGGAHRGGGICGHGASGDKNLASTSSLQRLQQSMDNSESIEICDFTSSSPDLVQHKSPYAEGSHRQWMRDNDSEQRRFGSGDLDGEYRMFFNRKSPGAARRNQSHHNDSDSTEESGGGCGGGGGGGGNRDRDGRRHQRTSNGGGGSLGCCRWLGCFVLARSQFNQFLARKRIEYGVRLYEKHNYIGAMRVWKSLIKSVNSPSANRSDFDGDDLFTLLRYLYVASINFGKYFDALEFAKMQLSLSEDYNLTKWRSESYLNLSLACEKLGKLKKSLSYARHSLYNECDRKSCLNIGVVYLTVARVYLEMGGFSRSLEDLHNSYRMAIQVKDIGLELKCYLTLSELFDRLRDTEKAVKYASKSYDLSRSLQLNNLNTFDHRLSLLRMASALRKNCEFGDAQDYCNEAIRLALLADDQSTYIRSLRIMGDIYRKNRKSSNYLSVAFQQYEQSMGLASMIGDRMGQMEAMDGAARCLEILRTEKKICNCRPLEFNTRLLEVANTIGSKLLVRKIRARLSLIYLALGDDEHHKLHKRLANQTDVALGLICGVCNEKLGQESNTLDVLPCAHIFHDHCAAEIYQQQQMNGTLSSSQSWKRSSLDFFQQRSHHQVYNCPACKAKYKPKKPPKKKTKKKSPSRSSPPTPPLAPLHARHCNRSKQGTLSRQHSLPNCQNLGFDDDEEDYDDEDRESFNGVALNADHLIDLGGQQLQDEDENEELIGGRGAGICDDDDEDDDDVDEEHNDEMLLLGLNELKKDFFYDNPKKRPVLDFEDELDVKLRELDKQHMDSMYHHQHQRVTNQPVLRNFCGEGLVYENDSFVYNGRDSMKNKRSASAEAPAPPVPPHSRNNTLCVEKGYNPNGNLSLASLNLRASSLTMNDNGDCHAISSV